MIGRDQIMNGMFVSCPRESSGKQSTRGLWMKVVQSCASSKAGVSGYSSSSGFLERSSATADRTVSGSRLPRIQFAYFLKMKIGQAHRDTS